MTSVKAGFNGKAPRVDSHLHVNYRSYTAKELISYMDREGIDQCWLLTWEETKPTHPWYQALSIDDVYDAYERYPDRFIPFYSPDPGRPDALSSLVEWHKKGIRGCGELKVSLTWDAPGLDPILAYLDQHRMPLVFHMEKAACIYWAESDNPCECLMARLLNTPRFSGIPRKTVEAMELFFWPLAKRRERMKRFFPGYMMDFVSLEARLRQYPNIKFIGHGPLFWKGISSLMDNSHVLPSGPVIGEGIICRLLSEYDNLYADLSAYSGYNALARDPQFARKFLCSFSGKLLYATDNFFLGLRGFLESLKLPADAYRRIYGENAHSLIEGCGNMVPASQSVRLERRAV
jgi:uncharacterized protein